MVGDKPNDKRDRDPALPFWLQFIVRLTSTTGATRFAFCSPRSSDSCSSS
jgi:hypothetical protein